MPCDVLLFSHKSFVRKGRVGDDLYRCGLLPGAALRVLQVGLAPLSLGALGFADDECAASQVFGFVRFVFCQSDLLKSDVSILARNLPLHVAVDAWPAWYRSARVKTN
jgi:hypothetical protein